MEQLKMLKAKLNQMSEAQVDKMVMLIKGGREMDNKVYCTMTPAEAATVIAALTAYADKLLYEIGGLRFTLEQLKAGGSDGKEA